jgi:hypothetical protein
LDPSAGVASLAALVLIAVTLGYLSTCAAWPFRACRRCHGDGKTRSPVGRAYRYCHRCDGTGLRLRAGRHVLNYLRRIHRDIR